MITQLVSRSVCLYFHHVDNVGSINEDLAEIRSKFGVRINRIRPWQQHDIFGMDLKRERNTQLAVTINP